MHHTFLHNGLGNAVVIASEIPPRLSTATLFLFLEFDIALDDCFINPDRRHKIAPPLDTAVVPIDFLEKRELGAEMPTRILFEGFHHFTYRIFWRDDPVEMYIFGADSNRDQAEGGTLSTHLHCQKKRPKRYGAYPRPRSHFPTAWASPNARSWSKTGRGPLLPWLSAPPG